VGETIDLLNKRVSIRKFKDEPVSEDLVEQVLRAAFRASNFRPLAQITGFGPRIEANG